MPPGNYKFCIMKIIPSENLKNKITELKMKLVN